MNLTPLSKCSAILFAALFAAAAQAQSPEAPRESAPADKSASALPHDHELAPGDKVRIAVFGQPELSGDYVVGRDGSLRLPVIGAIAAAGLSLAGLEEKVSRQLNNGYLRNPTVSASIAEFRPVHILGYVRVPGAYPFREGLSVLSAIAQAGGVGVPETQQGAALSEFLQAEERVRLLETTRVTLIVRRARLVAQQQGKEKLVTPDVQAPTLEPARLEQIIENEQRSFKIEREAQSQEVALLHEQLPRLKLEVSALQQQKETEERQRALNAELLADFEKLLKSGLTRKPNYIEVKREEARIEGNLSRLTAERLRAEIAIGDVEFKVGALRNAYVRRVLTELQEVDRALLEVAITLPAAQRLRSVRARQFEMGHLRASDLPSVTVVRADGAQPQRIDAALDFRLQPGDIVQVGSLMPAVSSLGELPAAAAAWSGGDADSVKKLSNMRASAP